MRPIFVVLFPVLFAVTGNVRAEDKKPEVVKPAALVANPIGLAAGTSGGKVKIRGLVLDQATEVKVQGSGVTVKLVGKGKAGVPDKANPKRVGDTQIDLEVTVAPQTPAGEVQLVIVTPQGEAPPFPLLIAAAGSLVERKPSTAGFRDAQPLEFGKVVDGCLEQPKTVCVFRFHGAAGKRIVADVMAARRGSSLDSFLSLYDARYHLLAASDDLSAEAAGGTATTDSRIEYTLPSEGDYFLTLIDAHDTASVMHVFRLSLAAP